MLSAMDLERLITVKRREIEKEKMLLGLSQANNALENDKENATASSKPRRQVNHENVRVLTNNNGADEEDKEETDSDKAHTDLEEDISPDLERYIRRYLGLPVMLKAGEYSPNNPLVRGERAPGDVLLALGEYERRRNTLRKIRQQQYREYLDQQAKKKQEAKEQAERERREREEKERQREEQRERDRLERERNNSPERRRTSVPYNAGYTIKVDTGVQVDSLSRPLSVAVQTDETELFRLSPSPVKNQLTQAERELSPHTVVDAHDDRPIHPAPWVVKGTEKWGEDVKAQTERRRSYGDERSSTLPKKSNRDKLVSDLRHTYMPSIFDADAIQLRNLQVEKEAAARRQFYQQELKNQILEQQRIREERKAREKMLEQAEMRRLEEQLRMLRVAQEREVTKQQDITVAIKDNTNDYEKKRTALQKEIDLEHQTLLRATSQPSRVLPKRHTQTSRSDTSYPSKLPFFYPRIQERSNEICNQEKRQPYSINIPENSLFNPNYDVDSYLRRNLNPTKESLLSNRLDKLNSRRKDYTKDVLGETCNDRIEDKSTKYIFKDYEDIDKETQALVHDRPKDRRNTETKYEPSFTRKNIKDTVDESLPIPVLRHSPKSQSGLEEKNGAYVSDAMKVVEDKWKVPAVQKNILKSLPNEEGKSMSILTQLGSIRRQLQLEQLKLDNMCKEGNE